MAESNLTAMKKTQQTTNRPTRQHQANVDHRGLIRFVGVAIAILICPTITATGVSADEASQDESSAKTPKESVHQLIAGEWTLHSAGPEGQQLQTRAAPTGHIRNGRLFMNGETFALKVVKASERTAKIQLAATGELTSATIQRFGNVLRMAIEKPTGPKDPPVANEPHAAWAEEAAVVESKKIVFEFWKVDPNRSKTVERLQELQLQMNDLFLDGRQEDMAIVRKMIAELTSSLKRMDVSPQITSLTQNAMQAREAGDHDSADKFETDAARLSKQLFADSKNSSKVQVFVATTAIEEGEVLNKSNSKLVSVDADTTPEGAISNPEDVWGQFATIARKPGDWILSQHVEENSGSVTDSIPAGYRVITIPADATTNHVDMLFPGNRIDLLLTLDVRDPDSHLRTSRVIPLLQYIEVFAVDSRQNTDADSEPARNISLLVTTEQAMKVQMARKKGNISTILRSSKDKGVIDEVAIEVAIEEAELLTDDTAQPNPFVGEWRLDSIEPESLQKEFVDDYPTIQDFQEFKSQMRIRNGILDGDDESIDLTKSAVRISEDKWEVSLPGEEPAKCWVRQFGNVLRLDFTGTGTDLVYEFFRVPPERKNITTQLINLNLQLSESRAAGDDSKLQELETRILKLNASLQQLDTQPQVDSLIFMAIRAREKGDHSSARQFENDAKELATMLQQLNPKSEISPTERITAALEKSVSLHYDKVPLAEILKEIAKTQSINIALDARALEAKGLKADAPISIHVDDISLSSALTFLLEQAGGIGFRIENEVLKLSPELLGNREFDRALLEKQRVSLIASLEEQETESVRLAKDYRDGLAKLPPNETSESAIETDQLAKLNIQLKRSVAFAFETRRKLQEVKLQLAELELAKVRAKHERRGDLADQIIQRRITDLISDEDLEWSKGNPDSATPPPGQESKTSQIDGEWYGTLEYAPEGSSRNAGENPTGAVFVTIADNKLAIDPEGLRGTIELIDDRNCRISVSPKNIRQQIFRGSFRRDNDTLLIICDSIVAKLTLNLRLVPTGTQPSPADRPETPLNTDTESTSQNPPPVFATPQKLVDYVTKLNADSPASMEHVFDVMTDDEINRFAGLMLRTTSMMQMAAGLGAAFGPPDDSEGVDTQKQVADFLKAVGRMNLIVAKYRNNNPSPEAAAAYKEIASGLDMSMLFQRVQSAPSMSVAEYSQKLRSAAGILSDPKGFLSELLKEIQHMEETQATADGADSDPASNSKPDWQITVNGDTAVAINRSAKPETPDTMSITGSPQQMELIKVGDTWKVSSMIPDKVIIEMQQGPQVTESSSPVDSPSAMQPSYQPASRAPEYVPSMPQPGAPVGENSAMATQALQPFTELNSTNVSNSPVFVDSDMKKVIDVISVQGRYINRPLEGGQMITAEMLMDKPTTQQVVEYWLNEAIAEREVFKPMRSLQHTYHRTYLYAMEFPFSASYAKRFNAELPDWTPDYLQIATKLLKQGEPVDWSQDELSILQSLGELIHYQTVNEKHSLATIAELLTTFVSLDYSLFAEELPDDNKKSKAAHSSLLLGELIRLTGHLPEKVLSSQPLDDAVVAKLQLLETMVQNSADLTWISQERRRLFGLAEEAPVQALRLLLTSKPISDHGLLESWIFTLSSEATYSAWRSAGDVHFAPPLDPVVAIAVAELLAGKDEATDNNLALLFQQQHPGYMFARHLDDLLSSELTYRDSVLQLLVSIYSKSKSPQLKANLAKMAPSVAVQAEE